MNRQQAIGQFLTRYFILELAIFGAIIVVGLLIGWRTTTEFSNALFLAGAAIILLGVTRIRVGNSGRGFKEMYAATVSSESTADRSRRLVSESIQGFSSASHMVLLGFTPIIASVVRLAVFGW